MIDSSTDKILKSLKASPELHREIKMESARTGEKIEVLVERAWRAFKSIANSSDPSIRNIPEGENVSSKTLRQYSVEITPEDEPWVHKLLQVRHSRKPGLRQALENNLHEFIWADEAFGELERHESPLVSGQSARSRVRPSTPHQLPEIAGTGKPGGGGGGRKTRFSARIDALEEADAEHAKGEKKPHGETG